MSTKAIFYGAVGVGCLLAAGFTPTWLLPLGGRFLAAVIGVLCLGGSAYH